MVGDEGWLSFCMNHRSAGSKSAHSARDGIPLFENVEQCILCNLSFAKYLLYQ